eukprot:1068897_1
MRIKWMSHADQITRDYPGINWVLRQQMWCLLIMLDCLHNWVCFFPLLYLTNHTFHAFFTGDHARHILTAVSTCHIKSTRPQREGTPGFYVGGSSILKELIAHQSYLWQDHTTKVIY